MPNATPTSDHRPKPVEIVDTCHHCLGTGDQRVKTERGTYMDEACYHCAGTGSRVWVTQ